MKFVKDKMVEMYSGRKKCFRAFEFTEFIQIEIVDDVAHMDKVLDYLLKQPFLAFDVEFCEPEKQNILPGFTRPIPNQPVSRKKSSKIQTMYKKIAASMQIAICEKVYWIDLIKLHSALLYDKTAMTPLKEKFKGLLHGPNIVRAFHGCESDVGVLYHSFNIIVNNIFDSSRATKFLLQKNFPDLVSKQEELSLNDGTLGLSDLSLLFLNINLDKSMQKAVWRVRPLPKIMLDYAVTDSIMLLGICYMIMDRLGIIRTSAQDGLERLGEKRTDEFIQKKIWAKSNQSKKWAKRVHYLTDYKLNF